MANTVNYTERQTVSSVNGAGMSPARRDVVKKKRVIFRTYQVIWYILGLVEAILLLRFILRFTAANPGSPFVLFIYSISAPIIAPFRGIYAPTAIEASVFEWIDIVAMIIYSIIAYGLVYLFQLIKPVKTGEVERIVDNP